MTPATSPDRRRVSRAASQLPLLLLVALIAGMFGLPIVMLLVGAFRSAPPGLPGEWSTDAVLQVYSDPRTWETFGNSVILSVTEHALGIALALFFAWVVARTNTPLRRLVTPIMVIVFAVPNLFVAISYGLLGGSPNGLLNRLALTFVGGDPRVVFDTYSWWGLIFVGTLKVVPVMYLLLLGPVLALNRSLEEAAVMSGGGRAATFLRIQIPLLAPALSGLAVLGFVVGLGQLDVPLVLGRPAGIYVFPSQVYQYLAGGSGPQYAQANALSILLVVVILLLVILRRQLLGDREFTTVTGKSYNTDRWDVGGWKWVCTAAIVLYAIFALVLPVGQVVVGSLQPIFGVGNVYNFSNYERLFADPVAMSAVRNSILVGVVGGFLAACLAVVIAYTARRAQSRLRRVPESLVWLTVAFPGIVLSLGMVWAYLTVPFLRPLYGTLSILLIALVVYISPTAVRAIDGAVVQIDRELEESARMSGASAARTLSGIVARLIAPSFLATWFVAGVAMAGNLDVAILLSGPGNQTVPVLTYNFYSQNGQTQLAAALLCLLLGIVAAIFIVGRLVYTVVRTAILRGRRRVAPLTVLAETNTVATRERDTVTIDG